MAAITIETREATPDEARIGALLRQATAHKSGKDYEAAIACLREAYALMQGVHAGWGFQDYFRLPRCLHLAGRYDEAIAELHALRDGLADRERRRKAAGFASSPPAVQRNIRAMINREIQATQQREQKSRSRQK